MTVINGVEIPHYTCHKEVQALEIKAVVEPAVRYAKGYDVVFADERFGRLFCPDDMFVRYSPQEGDFLVFYANDYKSFSPRKMFLDGYAAKE